MKWFLGAYMGRYNARNRLRGHLSAGRYKSLLVDNRDPQCLRTVCDSIHLNPSRAKILAGSKPLESYPWSSYVDYLKKPSERPAWLRVDCVQREHGIRRDDARGRAEFSRRMERLRESEGDGAEYKEIRRGWRFGREDFVAEILEKIEAENRRDSTGPERAESMEERARRLISSGLQKAGWKREDLEKERKGHPVKAELARQLRRETTMTLQWIAKHLSMGS